MSWILLRERGILQWRAGAPEGGDLIRDVSLLFAGRAVRAFCLGAAALALPLVLAAQGYGAAALGTVLTLSLLEDAVVTIAVGAASRRYSRRRLLIVSTVPMVLGGLALASAHGPWLLAAVVFAVLSAGGLDAGPFSSLEQAALAEAVPAERRTWAFAWYSLAAFLPAALGALAAGAWLGAAGPERPTAARAVFVACALGGFLMAVVYARLAPHVPPATEGSAGTLGLTHSRGIVLQIAGLQALDAFAGGFIVQSLLVWWFAVRFGAGPEFLGPLFFGTQALSALSFLLAPRIADRFGLLNTMVFTHTLSNALLALVALAPTAEAAAAALLARHLFSQMDVPTRQAYTMALVAPEERAPAAAVFGVARGLAQALSPALGGLAVARSAFGLPFFLAAGLKTVYDLALYFRLRHVRLR